MATFSVWEGDECGISLKRGAGAPAYRDGTPMDPAAVKVLQFEASSWNEACQRQNDHYGWGRYEPRDLEEIGSDEA